MNKCENCENCKEANYLGIGNKINTVRWCELNGTSCIGILECKNFKQKLTLYEKLQQENERLNQENKKIKNNYRLYKDRSNELQGYLYDCGYEQQELNRKIKHLQKENEELKKVKKKWKRATKLVRGLKEDIFVLEWKVKVLDRDAYKFLDEIAELKKENEILKLT